MLRSLRCVALMTTLAMVLGACRSDTPSRQPTVPPAPSPSQPIASPSASIPATGPSASTEIAQRTARWTRLELASDRPPARVSHTWTVDPSGAVAYLFAGRGDGGFLGDLWAFDMTADAWAQLVPVGPSPAARAGHVAAWVDGIGLVVFGGRTAVGVSSELWAYDPEANGWRRLTPGADGPAARADACGAVGVDGRLWVSHGEDKDGAYFDDVWIFDAAASTWSDTDPGLPAPMARAGSACWWSSAAGLMIYGGRSATEPAHDDVWSLGSGSAVRWQAGPKFPARGRAAAAVGVSSSAAYVFGGAGQGDTLLGDLLGYDMSAGTTERFAPASEAPGPRAGATLIDDPGGERLLLFGGRVATGPVDDVWSVSPP